MDWDIRAALRLTHIERGTTTGDRSQRKYSNRAEMTCLVEGRMCNDRPVVAPPFSSP